jgi:general secretion pathway protein D
LVLLVISVEVSLAIMTGSSSLDSPTISQRRVSSTVAVEDGQTIGLAGLITDSANKTTAGLPILADIPVIGLAFGARGKSLRRTELIVQITPKVIRGRDEGDAITRELREKLRLTIPVAARQR